MPDQLTTRIALGILGAIALVVVVGGIVLANNGKEMPGELIAIGSAASGALVGVLVTSKAVSGE